MPQMTRLSSKHRPLLCSQSFSRQPPNRGDQHEAFSFYLGSDALPLVTPHPIMRPCGQTAFQCHRISCAVVFCRDCLLK